jgi:hypothetical protein
VMANGDTNFAPPQVQATTNIFRNAYQQPENKLTYNFLTLLEHLALDSALGLLALAGLPRSVVADDLRVSLLYGGFKGNPDGSIALTHGADRIEVLFENKTWRRPLDLDQIRRHMRSCMRSEERQYLLVISADKQDRNRLAELEDTRLLFTSWHDILEYVLRRNPESPKDLFLFRQFAEYLEASEEAWRARMLSRELISGHSAYLRCLQQEKLFAQESYRFVDALKEAILPKFDADIESGETCSHWGRICVETTLKKAPYEQSILFGIYQEPKDGVKFKHPNEPEFVIFWMVNPANREGLNAIPQLAKAIEELKQSEFQFNFPRNEIGNAWHVAYWQRSMSEFVDRELSELHDLFSKQLQILIESRFFKLARDSLTG